MDIYNNNKSFDIPIFNSYPGLIQSYINTNNTNNNTNNIINIPIRVLRDSSMYDINTIEYFNNNNNKIIIYIIVILIIIYLIYILCK